jgi:hypothetical protein
VSFARLPKLDPSVFQSRNFENAVRVLHILAGVSYYKLYFGADIDSSIYNLSSEEADLFNDVYSVGLSEFIFRNGLRFQNSPMFAASPKTLAPVQALPKTGAALVPLGGGKDSLVTLEAMKRVTDTSAFFVGENAIVTNLADIAGVDLIQVRRKLDPRLFELNKEGRLNGHVPVTAINSAIAVLTALLHGFSKVVFSNERSADFGNNLSGDDYEINHQWSKSSTFERKFAHVVRSGIDPEIQYFSALRDLNEMQILQIFKNLTEYHHHFTSCNRAFRIHEASSGGWCGECEKCAFVFLAGSATIGHETMLAIFKKNLFLDDALVPAFLGLCGLAGERKPFECVGETDECRAAAQELLRDPAIAATPVGKHLTKEFSRLGEDYPTLDATLRQSYTPLGLGAETIGDLLSKLGQTHAPA